MISGGRSISLPTSKTLALMPPAVPAKPRGQPAVAEFRIRLSDFAVVDPARGRASRPMGFVPRSLAARLGAARFPAAAALENNARVPRKHAAGARIARRRVRALSASGRSRRCRHRARRHRRLADDRVYGASWRAVRNPLRLRRGASLGTVARCGGAARRRAAAAGAAPDRGCPAAGAGARRPRCRTGPLVRRDIRGAARRRRTARAGAPRSAVEEEALRAQERQRRAAVIDDIVVQTCNRRGEADAARLRELVLVGGDTMGRLIRSETHGGEARGFRALPEALARPLPLSDAERLELVALVAQRRATSIPRGSGAAPGRAEQTVDRLDGKRHAAERDLTPSWRARTISSTARRKSSASERRAAGSRRRRILPCGRRSTSGSRRFEGEMPGAGTLRQSRPDRQPRLSASPPTRCRGCRGGRGPGRAGTPISTASTATTQTPTTPASRAGRRRSKASRAPSPATWRASSGRSSVNWGPPPG